MHRTLLAAVLLALSSLPALGQQMRGATITGTVRDSVARPIADADIVARPGNHRTRSDSAGNFMLTGLDDGSYTVAARKVGYAPDRWDVRLSKSGRVDVKLVLARRPQLDTIVVAAKNDCPAFSVDGFMCRRHFGGGMFLDYPDIDDRGAVYTADLLRDVPGFRVVLRRTRQGPVRVPAASNGYGCIRSLVDGRPASPANQIPISPAELSALEVYTVPDSVPSIYQRYTWPAGNFARTGRCSVIVYWTIWAPMTRAER